MNFAEQNLTGKASIDKPWLNFYPEEFRNLNIPRITMESFLKMKNPDKNTIRWSFYYEQMTDPVLQKIGDTLNAHVLDDAYVIVERIESQCSGFDTCHIFVKDVRSFIGGEEDGFMSKGSGFYYKPIEYTDEVCEGNVATLYVPVVGDDFYRYKWT